MEPQPAVIRAAASAHAQAIAARDLERVRAACTEAMWERSGGDHVAAVPLVVSVELLGTLGRRSLTLVEAPGSRHGHYALEDLWVERDGRWLVEDERLFTLAVGEAAARAGETKLAVQAAARELVAALNRGEDGAEFFAQAFHGEPPGRVQRAELIATVATRTLVRLRSASTATAEYLWRDHDGRWLVAAARVFRLA